MTADVEGFVRQFAPQDVRATVAWLLGHGYVLTGRSPETSLSTFGSSLTYTADAAVTITVDRSQWHMDIAPTAGAKPYSFDLLIAALLRRPYWECFPATDKTVTGPARELAGSGGQPTSPSQFPPGTAWRYTLPAVLGWLADSGNVASAVALAQDQRYAVMWPDAAKTKTLRRTWQARGLPVP